MSIEREASVNFGGDSARNNFQDLVAEFDEESIKCSINLLIEVLAFVLAVLDGDVYEFGVFGLFRCSEDERGVSGGILGLVFADCWGWLEEVVVELRWELACEITYECVSWGFAKCVEDAYQSH